MVYSVIPVLVVGMLGYMFWRAGAQMRRDRVLNQREATRGKHAFTPLRKARYLFNRAFQLEEREPDWHAQLCSSLDAVPVDRTSKAGRSDR